MEAVCTKQTLVFVLHWRNFLSVYLTWCPCAGCSKDKPPPLGYFRILGVPTFISGNKFATSMARQNKMPLDKISLTKDAELNGKRNLKFKTTATILRTVMRNRHVTVNGRRYVVHHHRAVKQCYKCLELSHTQSSCPNEQRCAKCGELGHGLAGCHVHKYRCHNCDMANQERGSKLNSNHKATDNICPQICLQMFNQDQEDWPVGHDTQPLTYHLAESHPASPDSMNWKHTI